MSKFTPRWHREEGPVGVVIDDSGEQICVTSERKEYAGDRVKQWQERNKTADFISAAPDMYEALQSVVENWEPGYRPSVIREVEQALAKADGK